MTPWVKRLIIANVLMFFLQQTVPWVTGALDFVPALVLSRPWTMVTYMFLHSPRQITHILFNMLGLWFTGPRVEMRLGSQRFFALYMIAGISGALLSFVFAPYSPILGASGAVFGVMLAYARFWPRDRFLIYFVIPVEARWMILGYVAWSIWSGWNGSRGGVADFAHLGGIVGAFVYLQFLSHNAAGKKWQRQVNAAPAARAIGDWSKVDRSSIHEVNRDEVNRILDKISASGLGSLTPAERLFLSNFVPPDDRKPPVS